MKGAGKDATKLFDDVSSFFLYYRIIICIQYSVYSSSFCLFRYTRGSTTRASFRNAWWVGSSVQPTPSFYLKVINLSLVSIIRIMPEPCFHDQLRSIKKFSFSNWNQSSVFQSCAWLAVESLTYTSIEREYVYSCVDVQTFACKQRKAPKAQSNPSLIRPLPWKWTGDRPPIPSRCFTRLSRRPSRLPSVK